MKRFLGMSGMVLAVAGALISIVMIFGGWYGRGVVNDTVAQLVPGIDELLARESDQLANVSEIINDVKVRIGSARTRVQDFTGGNAEEIASFVQGVEGTVERVVTPVQNIRSQIATLRTSILMFSSVWNGAAGFLNLPALPTERLQAMDDRSREIDARIDEIQDGINSARDNIAETRATITASLDNLDATLSRLADDSAGISTRLSDARANLASVQARISAAGTLLAVFLSILGLCILALFVNLFYSGWLQWQDGSHTWVLAHAKTTTTDVTTHAIEGGMREVKTVTVVESEGRKPADEEQEGAPKKEADDDEDDE